MEETSISYWYLTNSFQMAINIVQGRLASEGTYGAVDLSAFDHITTVLNYMSVY